MKKIICGILAAMCMISLLSACGEPIKEPPEVGFLVAAQFSGYRLGFVKDHISKDEITERIDSPDLVKFSSVGKAVNALKNNKIHGLVLPEKYANEEIEKNPDLSKLHMTFIEKKPCALHLAWYELSLPINAAATRIRNDGTAEKIAAANSGEGKGDYTRPSDYDKVEGRLLRVGIPSFDKAPLHYKDSDGNLCGINVDTAYEFAKEIHAEIEIREYEDDAALMAALDSNEIDLAISEFIPSEENPISGKYSYTHEYTDQSVHILINGPTPAAANGLGAMMNK